MSARPLRHSHVHTMTEGNRYLHLCSQTKAPVTSRRSETWLLLSTKPVDLRRLWTEGAGSATVTTASIIYSPTCQLKTTQPSERIATTAVELAEMIAATTADRILCIEDAHHADHSHHVHHQVLSQISPTDRL